MTSVALANLHLWHWQTQENILKMEGYSAQPVLCLAGREGGIRRTAVGETHMLRVTITITITKIKRRVVLTEYLVYILLVSTYLA